MYVVEQFEGLDFDAAPVAGEGSSTQQLLDDLLGRFEDDDSPMSPTYADSVE
jgi:hypothetical protein